MVLLKVLHGNIRYLLILGVVINTVILAALMLSIFSKRLIFKLVQVICKVLNKFHYRNTDRLKKKCFEQIKEYKRGARLLFENKKVLFKIVATTVLQVTLYHSIPYIIYLSLGLGEANLVFLAIYKVLFPESFLSSAMLLSRGISFYLFVLLSGISVLCFSLRKKVSKT